jgi:hypothetical protein
MCQQYTVSPLAGLVAISGKQDAGYEATTEQQSSLNNVEQVRSLCRVPFASRTGILYSCWALAVHNFTVLKLKTKQKIPRDFQEKPGNLAILFVRTLDFGS